MGEFPVKDFRLKGAKLTERQRVAAVRKAKAKEFPQVMAGEQVMPEMTGYRMKCCDCGLVHVLNFEVREVLHPNDDGSLRVGIPENVERLRVILSATRETPALTVPRAICKTIARRILARRCRD